MCPLCEPCVEQAALCCSLFIYVYNTEISVFWVLGIYTTLYLQSLFSSYHSKGGNELSCIYEHFCFFWELFSSPPIVSPVIWRLFFLFLLLGYSVSKNPFSSSWKETHVTHEENRKKLPIQTGTKGSCCDASQWTHCWESVRCFSITGGRVHCKQIIQLTVPPLTSILCKPIH